MNTIAIVASVIRRFFSIYVIILDKRLSIC
jgi:hypothetical protein